MARIASCQAKGRPMQALVPLPWKKERLGAVSLSALASSAVQKALTNGFQALGGKAWNASLYMRSGRKDSASGPYTYR